MSYLGGREMSSFVEISGRRIGNEYSPYIICEISANHNGDINRAKKLIKLAKDTGCDAIKLQTYTPDTLTLNTDSPDFMINDGLWKGHTLHDLYSQAFTPFEWHEELFEFAKKLNLTIFSTPFDSTAVDLLESLDCPAYKIASFEIVDLELIAYVASKQKPMIISTGLANVSEISDAVATARANGCQDVILLHCISSYPAPSKDSNLRTIPHLAKMFQTEVGLSDHTSGTAVSVAAVAMGARVIEKHFTNDRSLGGPDSSFSLEPDEFSTLCADTKNAFEALGQVSYEIKGSEETNIKFRRSLYFVKNLKIGSVITYDSIRSVRPGFGLPPKEIHNVIGKKIYKAVRIGDRVSWDIFKPA